MDSVGSCEPQTRPGDSEDYDETRSYVSVDSVHPRFLHPNERPPVSDAASTDDFFCEQCKMMFPGTVEGIRRHFRTISHSAIASCRYCGGEVYEYVEGNHKRLAHDCSHVRKVKK